MTNPIDLTLNVTDEQLRSYLKNSDDEFSPAMVKDAKEKAAVAARLLVGMKDSGAITRPGERSMATGLAAMLVDKADEYAGMISKENSRLLMVPGGREAYRSMLIDASTLILVDKISAVTAKSTIGDLQVGFAISDAAALVGEVLDGVQRGNTVDRGAEKFLFGDERPKSDAEEFAARQSVRQALIDAGATPQDKPSDRPGMK